MNYSSFVRNVGHFGQLKSLNVHYFDDIIHYTCLLGCLIGGPFHWFTLRSDFGIFGQTYRAQNDFVPIFLYILILPVQVVTFATYTFYAACIIGRQYIEGTKEIPFDAYVPIWTILQLLVYLGLLKVGIVKISLAFFFY